MWRPQSLVACLCMIQAALSYNEVIFHDCNNTAISSCTRLDPNNGRRFAIPQSTKVVTKDLFQNKTELLDIAGSGGEIEKLEPGCFEGLPKIKQIFLGGQKLKEIPYGVFNGVPVRKLYLAANNIKVIQTEAFDCKQLFAIYLDKNELEYFDTNWFPSHDLESLDGLYIHHNKIRSINRKAFYKFSRVTVIDFSFNELEYISDDIFNRTHCIRLFDLSFNKLKTLNPNSFRGLKCINQIILSFNHIKNIDLSIFMNTDITQMSIIPNAWTCSCLNQFESKLFNSKVQSIIIKDYLHGSEFNLKYQLPVANNSNGLPICLYTSSQCNEEVSSLTQNFEVALNEAYNVINSKCKKDGDCNMGMLCKSDYCWSVVSEMFFKNDEYLYWNFLGLSSA